MLTFMYLVFVVIILLYYYLKRYKGYWRKRNVVEVDGILWNFLSGNRSLSELYKELYDRYSDEKYVGFIMGMNINILLKDVNDISFVLQGDFQNFHSRGLLTNPNDLLADNLLFMNDYPRWRLLRQKLTPVFTNMKLKNMFYIMERCATHFVEFIEEDPQLRSNPFNALYTYTTGSIAASVFGIDTQSKNIMNCPFMDMAWRTLEPNFIGNMKIALSNFCPSLFKLLNLKTFGEHEKFFIGFMKRVLESRRKCEEMRYDFIDTCLELQRNGILQDSTTGYELEPSDEVLAAQAFFFFVAGTDTSASTMNYTLLELSNNPAILKRVHEEIDKVFDNNNGTLTYDDVDKFVYLEMVINEALRKYPPIGLIQRACMRNTILPTGLRIEKGTIATIPIYALHRDETYYSKPEMFDPERFASDSISDIPKGAYLPFGGGNRICIGLRFARLQMIAGLASLLRRFTLLEQNYKTERFRPSFFALRDPNATYELVIRN